MNMQRINMKIRQFTLFKRFTILADTVSEDAQRVDKGSRKQ